MSKELKPCQCGSKDIQEDFLLSDGQRIISCMDCGMMASDEKTWNNRPIEDKLRREVALLNMNNEKSKRELIEWEDEEALVCPEDVGFSEYIKTLKQKLEMSRLNNGVILEVIEKELGWKRDISVIDFLRNIKEVWFFDKN